MKRNRTGQWTLHQIDTVKAAVKVELDDVQRTGGDRARVNHAMAAIRDLETHLSGTGRLMTLIFIMSVLVQHQRHPVLTPTQVEGLMRRAYAILQTQRIKPAVSRLSILYRELHQVRSLIYRREGDSWRSAWEQHLAESLSVPDAQGDAIQALAVGNRVLRQGHAALAYKRFDEAEQTGTSLPGKQLAQIGRVRALRLSGQHHAAMKLAGAALQQAGLTADARQEVSWELLSSQALMSQDFLTLVRATSRDGTHFQASYVIDAFLWASALQTMEPMQRATKMRTLARHPTLKMQRQGLAFEAALALENCYDTGIPLILRLQTLGDLLGQAGQLLSIDKEIMFWAAAARWLNRVRSFDLALSALKEYEAQSLRLSDGKNNDVLAVAGDLMQAPWFAGNRWA